MLRVRICIVLALSLAPPALADTVVLQRGDSYSGSVTNAPDITFTGDNGVQYKFPRPDVLSIAFTAQGDVISLRDGKSYHGQYTGANPIPFTGMSGVEYDFPVRDVATLVFNSTPAEVAAAHPEQKVIPEESEIVIRSDEEIDSKISQPGKLYAATIVGNVADAAGGVGIPGGSRARLVVRNVSRGGATGTPEVVLDLFSVDVGGKEYRVLSSNVYEKGHEGLGANRRTLELTGGGGGLGALLGGIFGGGKGAGIGAASGAAGGLITQLITRGKQVHVPAETEMYFRLYRNLILTPGEIHTTALM